MTTAYASPALQVRSSARIEGPTARWTPMKYHAEQERLWRSTSRFVVCTAGRRSGKSEKAKRRLVKSALTTERPNARFIASAPTHTQAREIFWEDLKALTPRFAMLRDPVLTPIPTIFLINGARIQVIGMDRPARVEGSPVDGIVMDEYGNMRAEAWDQNVRPALSTLGRPGWAWLIGVPEGRNHYYDKYLLGLDEDVTDWESFHWRSESVLPPEEIAAAKAELDELTFEQEYGGSFVNFEGRAYYVFSHEKHVGATYYDETQPLAFCIDFNAKPGNASIVQEHPQIGTQVIDEVFINRYSNTVEVCERFIEKYASHKGEVHLYGDPAGRQHKSSALEGTDWDLVRRTLTLHFKDRVRMRVPMSAPSVRQSINTVNSRLSTGLFRVDSKCKWMIKSLDGALRNEEGELIKGNNDLLTHLTDGLRYYMSRRHPLITASYSQSKVM